MADWNTSSGESMIAIPQSWSFRAFAGSNSNAQLSVMGLPNRSLTRSTLYARPVVVHM